MVLWVITPSNVAKVSVPGTVKSYTYLDEGLTVSMEVISSHTTSEFNIWRIMDSSSVRSTPAVFVRFSNKAAYLATALLPIFCLFVKLFTYLVGYPVFSAAALNTPPNPENISMKSCELALHILASLSALGFTANPILSLKIWAYLCGMERLNCLPSLLRENIPNRASSSAMPSLSSLEDEEALITSLSTETLPSPSKYPDSNPATKPASALYAK